MAEESLFAFVLMPFRPEFDDIYKLGIKDAASQVGINAERLDEQMFGEGMLERIYRQIESADIIIADMSGQSSNVFYEVGWAHAKGKLCILLTNDAKDIPFDLKHRRHIEYKGSITHLKSELIRHLEWAKREVENTKKSKLRIEIKEPTATLKTTSFAADATFNFKVNIFNELTQPFVEINAIYFYTGNRWTVTQGENECPSTESDMPDYEYRYFLTTPATRLSKGSWAQLQFKTTRRLANKLRGDAIQDSYRVSGHFVLRFVTSDGNFDYTHAVDMDVEEIPF